MSELEHLVLGIVWKEGAVTPHGIRTNAVMARNSRFSGSAGAIYPLVKRLERRRLLHSRRIWRGEQALILYETTREGRMALRTWIMTPWTQGGSGALQDPIRLRVYFLGVLTASKRRAFLDDTEQDLRRQKLARQGEMCDDIDRCESYRYVSSRGAIAVCRAQLHWIQEVGATLEQWP